MKLPNDESTLLKYQKGMTLCLNVSANIDTNYDFTTLPGAIVHCIEAELYIILAGYLAYKFIHTLVTDPKMRQGLYFILFYSLLLVELLIKICYFPGGLTPFCYSMTLYAFLSDYPSLAQSLSILMVTCQYCNTLALVQEEQKRKFLCFKWLVLLFAIVYMILFIFVHELALQYNQLMPYYVVALSGQIVILTLFDTVLIILLRRLKDLFETLASGLATNKLIAFSILLGIRILISVLNIAQLLTKLRISGMLYILSSCFNLTCEVAPILILLSLFSVQGQKKAAQTSAPKVDIAALLQAKKTASLNSSDLGLARSDGVPRYSYEDN